MTVNERKTCPRCNRVLKSHKSIMRGIGPICEKKLQEENERASQQKISLIEEENNGQ
ncbi:DUF6011 domain-containing protein [Bacillus safensis]|uniref:DUF6011 domain-containing protein n=1 Tax=Bacillus safensis TaxID=561879 RepID=UPI003F5A746D